MAPSSTTQPPLTTPATAEQIGQVVFVNALDGHGLFHESHGAACSISVAATSDGGHHFTSPVRVSTFACGDPPPVRSMAFDAAGDGYLYGQQLLISHNSGATWTAVPGLSDVLSVIPLGRSVWVLETFCSQTSGACDVRVDASGDGGRSWSPVRLPAQYVIEGAAPAMLRTSATTTLIAVPEVLASASVPAGPTASAILNTSDGGRDWHRDPAPCSGQSTFLSQAPGGAIWMACASEPGAGNQAKELARSFDGGISWTEVRCPAGTGPWSGSGCYFSGTMDGGYLGDLVATSSTTAFMAGGRNDVFVTRDGGGTWSPTDPPIGDMDSGTGPLFFANPSDGWVISGASCSASQLWATSDGGSRWSEIWSPAIATTEQPGGV